MVTGSLIGAGGPFDTPSVGLAGEVRFSSTVRDIRVKTDGEGRFVVHLPPGEYWADGAASVLGSCNGVEPLKIGTTEVRDVLVICNVR